MFYDDFCVVYGVWEVEIIWVGLVFFVVCGKFFNILIFSLLFKNNNVYFFGS